MYFRGNKNGKELSLDNIRHSKSKTEYNMQYAKNNLKRIPLDVQKEEYEVIKEAATAAGEKVNGYIKKAVRMRIESEQTPE